MLKPAGGSPDPDEMSDEAPLDPEVERVQSRLKRLMWVSLLTTLIGFSAVAVALFWRLSRDVVEPDAPVAAVAPPIAALPADLSVALPTDVEVVAVAGTPAEILVHVRSAEGAEVIVVSRTTGSVVQRIRLRTTDR